MKHVVRSVRPCGSVPGLENSTFKKGNNLQKIQSLLFNPSVFIQTNLHVFSAAVFRVKAEEIPGNISRVYLEACFSTAYI